MQKHVILVGTIAAVVALVACETMPAPAGVDAAAPTDASSADSAATADSASDGGATPDAANVDSSSDSASDAADASSVCLGATAVVAAADVTTGAAQGAPDTNVCTGTTLPLGSSKYSTSRALLKFRLPPHISAKFSAGLIQNLRLRFTLVRAGATAGQAPCLIGPPGNQINNCRFAFRACPMLSTWEESPANSCPTHALMNPSAATGWPAGTFESPCAVGAIGDYADSSITHAGEVVEVPIAVADVMPYLTAGELSLFVPPLSPNSQAELHSREAAVTAMRPQLAFDCNP
jgi:hypothetical protein